MKNMVLDKMIWPEVEDALAEVRVALVPVGSCEQHGPNTTFDTDTVRAYEFSKLLAERMGVRVIVCPPVTYGISPHHMDFPGTITLRAETMISMLTDIAVSLNKHGIQKVLFVNGHGGNRASLGVVITKLKSEHGIDAYWSGMGTPIARKAVEHEMEIPESIGHACEIETSQTMYLHPDSVRSNRVPGEVRLDSPYFLKPFLDGGAPWSWRYDVSENGALGDATKATVELGRKMTEAILDYMENLINTVIDV